MISTNEILLLIHSNAYKKPPFGERMATLIEHLKDALRLLSEDRLYSIPNELGRSIYALSSLQGALDFIGEDIGETYEGGHRKEHATGVILRRIVEGVVGYMLSLHEDDPHETEYDHGYEPVDDTGYGDQYEGSGDCTNGLQEEIMIDVCRLVINHMTNEEREQFKLTVEAST